MAWLIWTEPDPEMIKAKGVWGIQRERMTERIWLMLFFLFPFCEKRRTWEEWSEWASSSQTGWCLRGLGGRGVLAHRIARPHSPIKSIRIVRGCKKTGNHCKKWSFFYQLLNTECTPWSSLSSAAPVPCLSISFSLFFFLPATLSLSLTYSLWVGCISTKARRRGRVFKAQLDSLLACRCGSFSGFYSQTVGPDLKEMPSTSPLKHLSLPFSLAIAEMISEGSHLLIHSAFLYGVLKNKKGPHSACHLHTHIQTQALKQTCCIHGHCLAHKSVSLRLCWICL